MIDRYMYGVGLGVGWGGGSKVHGHAHADLHTRWMLRYKIFLSAVPFLCGLPSCVVLAPGLCLVFSNFALNLLISRAALDSQLSKLSKR